MKLTDNQYINDNVAGLLAKDNWTMDKIATANPAVLEKYKGIGAVTAKRIIDEAKRLVNEARLHEAAVFVIPPMPEPEQPAVSVRVRRIMEQNKK